MLWDALMVSRMRVESTEDCFWSRGFSNMLSRENLSFDAQHKAAFIACDKI